MVNKETYMPPMLSSKSPINLEQLLKQSLDISPDCLCIADKKTIIYCNDVFASIYGLPKEETIGKDSHTLLREAWLSKKGVNIDTDDIDTWLSNLERVHESISLNRFETDMRDGRWFKMTRISLDSGYTVIMGVDITELKQTQKALEESNKQLQEANRQIELLANTDQLTGVSNRRALVTIANHEIAIATRYNQPLSLIALDIDYFKRINDTYGHEGGDDILVQFSQLCGDIIRESDTLCRVGGEEFIILLPMTDMASANELAERIRARIASHNFKLLSQNKFISITVSIGVSNLKSSNGQINDMISRADLALYKAKHNGRNRVCMIDE